MAMEIKHLTAQMHDLSTKAVGVACDAVDEISRLRQDNAELKAALESEKASRYAESVDAEMRERRLKRAMYNACAMWAMREAQLNSSWAYDASEYLPSKEEGFRKLSERWNGMEIKCRDMAEKFGG